MTDRPSQEICILTTSYPRTPSDEAAVFIGRLVEAMAEIGLAGLVLVPRDRHEAREETLHGFSIYRFSYGIFSQGDLAFGSGIMPNIRQKPARILQAPALLLSFAFHALTHRRTFSIVHCNWAITAVPALLVRLMYRTPYVITLRGEDIRLLQKPFFRILLKIPFRYAAAVTCVNQNTVAEIKACYPFCADKVTYIANGVEAEVPSESERNRLPAAFPELAEGRIALFVGTVIPRKQIHIIVEALSDPALSDWKLVVCGRLTDSAYVETITALTRERNISDRVFFHGPVAPDDISSYYARADLYVSASEHEGRPNSVLEALASGLPLLLSDIEPHQSLSAEYQRGTLFKTGATPDLVRKWQSISLKRKPVSLKRWTDCAGEYAQLFKQICASSC